MAKLIDITGKALAGEWGTDDETGCGIPVLRTTNFTNEGIVNYNDVVTRTITKKNINDKFLRKGDIIIEKSGGSDKFPVGRVVYFDGEENTYLFNNFTGLLRVKNQDVWYPRYVFYSLLANYKRGGTRAFENKTTGLHNLKTDDYVSRYEIVEADIEEQISICEKLDKLYGIIKSRKKELQLLDDLIKARFVEMFENDIKQSSMTISDVAEETTVGIANSATHAYSDSGVIMLRNQNIRVNYLDDRDLIYINQKFADKYKNKALQENDILVTRTGANVGMACIVPKKYAGCQTFTTLILRLRKDIRISPIFVCHYINSQIGKAFIDENKVGGGQPNFGAKQLATMPIFIPEVEKQSGFDAFVTQVDKSKFKVQKSLEETKKLMDSLMQQYFG